jgi:hypothetical protein
MQENAKSINNTLENNSYLDVSLEKKQKWDLEQLKKEFTELQTHVDENHQFDVWLNQLTKTILNLLQKEEALTKEQFDRHPELITLMQEVVRQVKSWNDIYKEVFTLSEEKKLLLDLMYNVLATIWRQEQERTVIWYTKEAVTFFQHIGLWSLYIFLEQKAQ